jgi:AcrR family transcriptional regulator
VSERTAAPPRRRTQAERRAESEQRLLEATAELIVERGIQRTSLADIGTRAGYSHALVNHLFGSKVGLVERLNEVADEYYRVRAAAVLDGPAGFDALAAVAQLYLALVAGPDPIGRVHLVLWAEAIAHTPEIRASRVTWDQYFRGGITALITGGIADGTIRPDIVAEDAALVIVGLLRGVALQMMLDPSCIDLETAQATVSGMLEPMLQPVRTPTPRRP